MPQCVPRNYRRRDRGGCVFCATVKRGTSGGQGVSSIFELHLKIFSENFGLFGERRSEARREAVRGLSGGDPYENERRPLRGALRGSQTYPGVWGVV